MPAVTNSREAITMSIFKKYCDNREIFFIEDRDGFYWINGTNGYYKTDWTIEEAVEDYKTGKGKAWRFELECRSWCD